MLASKGESQPAGRDLVGYDACCGHISKFEHGSVADQMY